MSARRAAPDISALEAGAKISSNFDMYGLPVPQSPADRADKVSTIRVFISAVALFVKVTASIAL